LTAGGRQSFIRIVRLLMPILTVGLVLPKVAVANGSMTSFRSHLGLQLSSLRAQPKDDFAGLAAGAVAGAETGNASAHRNPCNS
jgi:hypothetical protein